MKETGSLHVRLWPFRSVYFAPPMALEFSLDEEDVLQLHAQVRVLLDAELYESAIDAAQVAISASRSLQAPPSIGMGSLCDANVMAGDAARGLGEPWRAEVCCPLPPPGWPA